MGFTELFCPQGIAVFGSVSPGKLGGTFIDQLLVNRVHQGFWRSTRRLPGYKGVAGFSNVSDIPEKIDLALIVSPAATVAQVLEDCGIAGIKAAIIISSGFSETGNVEGEKKLQQIAVKYGIHFIGPNCAGLINTHWNCAPTFQALSSERYNPLSSHKAVQLAEQSWNGHIPRTLESQNLSVMVTGQI